MGLRDYLKKRRTIAKSEKRINKKAKRLFSRKKRIGPTPIERTIQNVSDQGIQLAWRAYHGTQTRKGEGKAIIMKQLKKVWSGDAVSSATRSLIRDPNRQRNRPKTPTLSGAKITRRRRRR